MLGGEEERAGRGIALFDRFLRTFDTATGTASDLEWAAPITENPAVGATEVWELYNFTEDAHPIHIHEIHLQVVDRQALGPDNRPTGPVRPPEVWETGFKDTVISYPGEVTRVRGRFDVPGCSCGIATSSSTKTTR